MLQAYKLRIWTIYNQNLASLAWKKKKEKKEKNCHNTSNRVSPDSRHFSEAKALPWMIPLDQFLS